MLKRFAGALALATICSCTGADLAASTTTSATPEPTSVPQEVSRELSPTVGFFSGGLGAAERVNLIEESVSGCMAELGWAYEPVILDVGNESSTVEDKQDFIREYGYGHYSHPRGSDQGRAAADANYEYWLGLSDEERLEYSADLGDENAPSEFGTPPEGRQPPEGSCRANAQAEMGLPVYDEPLMDRMRSMYVESRDSVELAAARLAYRGCMRMQGYRDVGTSSDADHLAFAEGANLPTAEAIELEIEIATADFECQLSTLLPVEQEIESQIVDKLIEEFPEYGP